MPLQKGKTNGFKRTSALLAPQIRKTSESRGFAVSKVLTQWRELVGEEFAATSRPVDVSYGKNGFGATLTVLTTGAQAPMLEMQKEQIRERVNAVYGYNAISRIRLTQTSPTGFSEGQAVFDTGPSEPKTPSPDPALQRAAVDLAADVEDEGLRAALSALGTQVLTKQNT